MQVKNKITLDCKNDRDAGELFYSRNSDQIQFFEGKVCAKKGDLWVQDKNYVHYVISTCPDIYWKNEKNGKLQRNANISGARILYTILTYMASGEKGEGDIREGLRVRGGHSPNTCPSQGSDGL